MKVRNDAQSRLVLILVSISTKIKSFEQSLLFAFPRSRLTRLDLSVTSQHEHSA